LPDGKFSYLNYQFCNIFVGLQAKNFGPFCVFYGHLLYFVVFGDIIPILACGNKKNLATLKGTKFFSAKLN
jgi:hypothetical protein